MNILLMTPPHTNPVGPTLGIAVLAAHLKKEFPDMEIKATDMGLDAVYWLLSEKNIENVICRLEEKMTGWNGQDTLNYEEQLSYAKAAGALCILGNFKTKVWKAINQLKDKESYQCDAVRKDATLIINKVLESIGEAFPHTQLNAGDYRTELSPFSIKDIESYVNHPEKSVYNDFFEEWLKQHDLSETVLIGLSISFAKQIFPSFLFASKLKQHYPNMMVIIGGSMMAHLNQEVFEPLFQWCDCIIQREGEYPLENIVKCLRDKRAFYPEMGAIYLNESGQMVQAAKMPRIDLNQELPPDFSNFRLKDYIVPTPNIPLQIGRSCYWGKCSFCCLNTAFEHKDCWTRVEKMVDDIEYLVKNQGIETIEFVDDAIPPVFAGKLSQELLKRQCHVKWFCYARFDEGFNQELFHLMHEAGCVGLKFGLESASEHVSQMMNKGIDLQKAAKIFEDASQTGIIPQAAFFFGFPGEKTEDVRQTVDFVTKYVLKNGIIAYNGIFRLLKSMPLLRNPDQYEINRIEKWNTDEELIDYYQVERKYNLDLDTIKKAEEELAASIDKDLTRSVDLRRYWFMGYNGHGQDVDIAEKYKSQMLVKSCFPLDQIRIMQDKNNGDFLPGKGIYSKKSYISGGLHQAEIMKQLCELRPKMKAQEEAIYSYDMKLKRFAKLENHLTFVTKLESEENILIGMKTWDGYIIEMVYSIHSKCLCISTQIGCKTGCIFCASGSRGFVRNLTAVELLEQYMWVQKQGYAVDILHFGGVGEPLRNLDAILEFKKQIVVDVTQITTSVPDEESFLKMMEVGFERVIISLHSMNDTTRNRLIPGSMRLPAIIHLLTKMVKEKPELKNIIRISYLLLGKENTSEEEQDKFIQLAKELDVRLLLLAYNVVNDNEAYTLDMNVYFQFKKKIQLAGIRCEDCVASKSRRDKIGGCGTLYIKKE